MKPFEIPLNEKNKIVVQIKEFRKKFSVDIRAFFLSDSDEWLPIKKGASIPAAHLDDFIKYLNKIAPEVGEVKEGRKPRKHEVFIVVTANSVKKNTLKVNPKYVWPYSGDFSVKQAKKSDDYNEAKRKCKKLTETKEKPYTLYLVEGKLDDDVIRIDQISEF